MAHTCNTYRATMRFPQSAYETGFYEYNAGCILMGWGRYRSPSPLGAMRAGVAIDLEKAALYRLFGFKDRARDQLAFCRDARRFQQQGL